MEPYVCKEWIWSFQVALVFPNICTATQSATDVCLIALFWNRRHVGYPSRLHFLAKKTTLRSEWHAHIQRTILSGWFAERSPQASIHAITNVGEQKGIPPFWFHFLNVAAIYLWSQPSCCGRKTHFCTPQLVRNHGASGPQSSDRNESIGRATPRSINLQKSHHKIITSLLLFVARLILPLVHQAQQSGPPYSLNQPRSWFPDQLRGWHAQICKKPMQHRSSRKCLWLQDWVEGFPHTDGTDSGLFKIAKCCMPCFSRSNDSLTQCKPYNTILQKGRAQHVMPIPRECNFRYVTIQIRGPRLLNSSPQKRTKTKQRRVPTSPINPAMLHRNKPRFIGSQTPGLTVKCITPLQ